MRIKITPLLLFQITSQKSGPISIATYTKIIVAHGRPQDFFQGWVLRGLKDGSPPAGSRGSSPVGYNGQPPEADDIFS